MKLFNQGIPRGSAMSYAALLEKIEILRSTLRWATTLQRDDIEKLLRQANVLRDDVMQLSHKERFVQAVGAEPGPAKSTGERRQALLARSFVFEGTFGDNPRLLDALEIAEKAAPTDLPVLVDGESGTGKELMAKVIHANGSRADKPYISVNCGAIPDSLLESELFGHKKGAFTGAATDRRGKFESAHHGTIFLDEIGELPLPGQVKLLRVLQSHEIQRVGSDETISVDTRIVAATNKNLRRLIEQGLFREDLFYRLSVIHLTLPPLRERKDEIPLLIAYYCDEAAEALKRRPVKTTARLRDFLLGYAYPGNIRELRNIVYRMSCLAGETADLSHLPEDIRPAAARGQVQPAAVALSMSEAKRIASDEAERACLERGLQETSGAVAELARRWEMNRSHLQILLKKHGMHSKDFRKEA
ncbi:sigma-54 interaction domain-containing protein [Duganella aceris]|uniref:Sigma-54-dependent Fis family transcriptional regulator n=1 Tax=Duganella aceris TaxID=2703883 RepID=A0ABX0FKT7_9BURK|nr:sigma-54 dependent transcriptional regulator [Duganella aceris]NGZ85132.1 sigma-54-dependent Fis family transcriptional regulator [Duganella aceris]